MTGHLGRVLLKVDRASMYHSLEVRVPMLDREVIAVAARIDWRSCLDVNEQTGKLPLRHALESRVVSKVGPSAASRCPWRNGCVDPSCLFFTRLC